MSKKNSLFKFKDVKNTPSRNGFDLSKRLLFTAKVGELLPVWNKRVMPGDKFKIDLQSFTRTQPLNSAAYTRVKEYFDFFFVPYRLLWRNAHQSFTMMTNNNVSATSPTTPLVSSSQVPHISLDYLEDNIISKMSGKTNLFGFDRAACAHKLLDYLRYTNYYSDFENNHYVSGAKANIFPVLAYNKIYYDFFRYTQWEDNKPQNYNVDYMTSSTNLSDYISNTNQFVSSDNMFDLKYCNFGKDLFIGLLPNSQYGDEAFVSVGVDGEVLLPAGSIQLGQDTDILLNSDNISVKSDSIGLESGTGIRFAFTSDTVNDYLKLNPDATNEDVVSATTRNLMGSLSVLQMRNANMLQKWKEIAQSGDPTYREQVKKHFGVTLPQALSSLCTYIGGTQGIISINEVVNNNLENEQSQANIFGKGIGTVNGGQMTFDVKEHGLIMCIYHAVPMVDYSLTGLSRELQSVDITDFAIPEFDRLGFEPVALNEFFNPEEFGSGYPSINTNEFIGYAPRYYSYKTDVDEVVGAFRTTLPNWVAQFDSQYLQQFAKGYSLYTAFKVNPHILDDVFNVQCDDSVDTDQLLVGANFDVMAVRNLDYNGLPY